MSSGRLGPMARSEVKPSTSFSIPSNRFSSRQISGQSSHSFLNFLGTVLVLKRQTDGAVQSIDQYAEREVVDHLTDASQGESYWRRHASNDVVDWKFRNQMD